MWGLIKHELHGNTNVGGQLQHVEKGPVPVTCLVSNPPLNHHMGVSENGVCPKFMSILYGTCGVYCIIKFGDTLYSDKPILLAHHFLDTAAFFPGSIHFPKGKINNAQVCTPSRSISHSSISPRLIWRTPRAMMN